jgi:hypothetical protein
MFAVLIALSPWTAVADIIPGMPDAIVCSVKDPTGVLPWERLVFYVSAHMRDGDTLYKSSTSDPVVLLVSADGVVNGANLADCDGRSIESLREENRAFSLTDPRSR